MKNKKILAITNKNTRLSLARKYIKNVTVVDSFDSISWPDIILRRIRLISIPGKHETTSTEQRAKRTAAKYLGLGLSSEIARKNFEDCLFDEHGCKTLFAPGYYGVSILKKHIDPEFNILELKDELKKERMLPFLKKPKKQPRREELTNILGLPSLQTQEMI